MKNLNKFINKSEDLPVDKFLNNVLYKKEHGYYSKKNPFGESGDFITSPSISFLFGEMLAIWIVSAWESLNKPKTFNLVELGPGNGQLCNVMINTFKKFPLFFRSTNIFLYEKSEKLMKIQKKKLNNKNIKWLSNLDKIKKGPVIFFGNEFFDAIPIKQFKKKGKIIFEKYIKIDNKMKIKKILKKAKDKDLKEIKKFKSFKKMNFFEYPKLGIKELDKIIKVLKKTNGALLLIDYGYLKPIQASTLQSVRKHKVNRLFDKIGEADITSLVNFGFLEEYFLTKDCDVKKVVSQSFFLKRIGILNRAEILSSKMNFKEKSDLYMRLKRLLDPAQMGELFKVMCVQKNMKPFNLGFE
ncbi:SAM-dependent methyltransferase [Pelagibacteraceae bacterium]|nr:SAM-dependent methyltransferase [Pelagibacteraceae bacterium]